MVLSKYLFWDVDIKEVSFDEHAKFVIPRVFLRGKMDDVFAVLKYYKKNKLIEVLTQTRYLDKKTLSFCCVIFDLNKEDFRCYKNELSIPEHLRF